ncbi:MAG: alpha/beta fold hydrolase [Candidatus Rokubacteria bacterium]|nr:alpha/beta fold hydrolase [Candidatus Rokubacteria bacterium]
MYYTLTGPPGAPVVVLLHGLGSSGDDWTHQAEALTDYRVLAVDLPGHHRSARPRGVLSVPAMAAAVERQLERLGIERAHVVGLSLGGCVGLALALRAPARVRSLVVVNGFARLRPADVRALVRGAARVLLALAAPMSLVGAFVAREAFPRPEHAALRDAASARLAANPRGHYLACLAALARFDIRERLAEIRCPTTVVAGAGDTTVPLAAKQALANGIPGARLHVVAESGHVTLYDQPAAFNAILREHLGAVDALGGA